jgi:hypothetical protein
MSTLSKALEQRDDPKDNAKTFAFFHRVAQLTRITQPRTPSVIVLDEPAMAKLQSLQSSPAAEPTPALAAARARRGYD